jgi:hypothetical protein
LNQSTQQLTQVLDRRVQTAIDIFEGERAQNLVEDANVIANQLAAEQQSLAATVNILNVARALPGQQDSNEVRLMQDAVTQQQNAVANYEAMGKIAREYVEEQTNILIGQQATRTRMPQILRSHHVDHAALGPSGVAARAIFGTVIQHMKAARDREDFRTKIDKLRGIESNKPSIDPDSVIKPSEIVKSNMQLKSILSVGAVVEKREVRNIRKFKLQMRDMQENIDGLENELNKMAGKTQELAHDKFRHRTPGTRSE